MLGNAAGFAAHHIGGAKRVELLQYEVQVESMGGDVVDVEVSAKNHTNLDKLLEAILLQAEILDLKANPDRTAEGVVIEAQLDKGRGPVATVLVQTGTLMPVSYTHLTLPTILRV